MSPTSARRVGASCENPGTFLEEGQSLFRFGPVGRVGVAEVDSPRLGGHGGGETETAGGCFMF